MFQGCVTAKDDDGECHNGYGLALKNLKQYEQATSEFKKAIDLDSELYDALYNAGMAYSDWFDEAHGNDQKERAREYLQKFVTNAAQDRRRQLPEGGERQAVRALRSVSEPTYIRRLHSSAGDDPRKRPRSGANTRLPGRFPVFSRGSPCYKNSPIFSSVSRT